MKFVYLLSIIYLIVSFLLYKKKKDKMSIVAGSIYSICLLFCYNILIVSIASFFNVGGGLFNYSLFNYFLGTIINFISFKRKKFQCYYFDKKEFFSVLFVVIIVFFIGCFRFRGFSTISYESADSSVHYRHALIFADNLEILDKDNSKDLVYGNFSGVMPISYVNCGFMMKILDNVRTYQVFMLFDVCCLMISSLLFLITMTNVLKKKTYIYSVVLTLMYLLAFPLSNLLFGFCYLGLGVMVINLLILTVLKMDNFNEDKFMKLFILFMLSFAVFFSYYLFMPIVYLTLGVYYIYLWRKKKITFKELMMYGIITLIIPFILGLIKFIVPGFQSGGTSAITVIGINGYIYDNKSSRYFFGIMSLILLLNCYRKRKEIDYSWFNFFAVSLFVLLFYILYKMDLVSLYYFYKLFYLQWFFVVVFMGNLFFMKKEFLYTIFIFIIMAMVIVFVVPDNLFSQFLVKNNIYSWNVRSFDDDKILLTKNEFKLVEESVKYNDLCVIENQFLISGDKVKNPWIYAITDNVPLFDWKNGVSPQLGNDNIRFDFWASMGNYECLIYFYEDNQINYEDYNNLEILYSNDEGAILRKK